MLRFNWLWSLYEWFFRHALRKCKFIYLARVFFALSLPHVYLHLCIYVCVFCYYWILFINEIQGLDIYIIVYIARKGKACQFKFVLLYFKFSAKSWPKIAGIVEKCVNDLLWSDFIIQQHKFIEYFWFLIIFFYRILMLPLALFLHLWIIRIK